MDNDLYDQYQAQSALQSEGISQQMAAHSTELQIQAQQVAAVVLESLNPRRVVENLIHQFKGEDPSGDGGWKKVTEPKLNSNGIQDIKYFLEGLLNQNHSMSDYDELQIRKIMIELSNDLVILIGANWKRWGMKKTDKNMVNNTILINILSIFNRAKEGGERNKILRQTMEILTQGSQIQRPKKGGFLDKLKF